MQFSTADLVEIDEIFDCYSYADYFLIMKWDWSIHQKNWEESRIDWTYFNEDFQLGKAWDFD
jgi:hypothetical protein